MRRQAGPYTPRQSRIQAAREEYIKRRLQGEIVSLREIANNNGLQHTSVRNYSSWEKWEDQVQEKMRARNAEIQVEIAKSHEQALVTINKQFQLDLHEIFDRHIKIARGMINIGVRRLNMLSEDDAQVKALTPDMAKKLVAAGTITELKIVDLAHNFLATARETTRNSPKELAAHQAKMRELAEEFADFVKKRKTGGGTTHPAVTETKPPTRPPQKRKRSDT